MTITCIDTDQCRRVKLAGAQGAVAEIVNRALCGAENVVGLLRWLEKGERFDAESLPETHQLIYLMEGDGTVTLENRDYEVSRGGGVYLGPGEKAAVAQAGRGPLKLFHLVVPKIRG
jgi:quercetin dioxygenase-like cupin family protein